MDSNPWNTEAETTRREFYAAMDSSPWDSEAGMAQGHGDSSGSFEFPPGVRFTPEDDELILYYLNPKINNQPLPYNIIFDVNLYGHSPEDLAQAFKIPGQARLYFFTPRSRKYPNGSRPARAAGEGYWKATGSERKIYSKGEQVGVKRTLVYYKGKARKADGVKTDWTMHEYISKVTKEPVCRSDDSMKLDDWVLCCIQKKKGAVDKANNQLQVFQAQSSHEGCMPCKQAACSTGSYQTNIDSNVLTSRPLSVASSKLMTGLNGMEQSLAIESSGSESYHNTMLQTPAAVPNEQLMADFDARGQPSNSAPTTELPEMMSDYSNYLIGQGFQQNPGYFKQCSEKHFYQFGGVYGESDEFLAPGSVYMEPPSLMQDYQPETENDDILNYDVEPKESDTEKDNRKDGDSKHAKYFSKPAY